MPKLKVLSGKEVLDILLQFGFYKKSQKGSHMKCGFLTKQGEIVLIVPSHGEMRTGTLHSIYKKLIVHIEEPKVRPHFYTE